MSLSGDGAKNRARGENLITSQGLNGLLRLFTLVFPRDNEDKWKKTGVWLFRVWESDLILNFFSLNMRKTKILRISILFF